MTLRKVNDGYWFFMSKDGKKINVHKRVAEKKYGKIPKDFVIHHIDGNKNNNRPANLILLHKKDHARLHMSKNLIIKLKKK